MILRFTRRSYLKKAPLMSASCTFSGFESLYSVNNLVTTAASTILRLPSVGGPFLSPRISKHCHTCGVVHVQKIDTPYNHPTIVPYGVSVASRPEMATESNKHHEDAATARSKRLLKHALELNGIVVSNFFIGTINHIICPKCKGGDTGERSLSLTIEDKWVGALWNCHRGKCGWSGREGCYRSSKKPRHYSLESLRLEQLCSEVLEYLNARMISNSTLSRNQVMQRSYDEQVAIAFTYWKDAELVGCSYRDIDRSFWQEEYTEVYFYGLDDILDAKDIIIVEGEINKLSMEEAGFRNCIGVPNGVQSKDSGFHCIQKCFTYVQKASRIILATNGNPQGLTTAEEIARRVGHEKCWRVKWPEKNGTENFNDANEVLMYLGPEALRQAVENAEMYPVRGLYKFEAYFNEINMLYNQLNVYEIGIPTGWASLNPLYNVVPGELTVLTGVPNSGKSEWIDALMCNINSQYGWTFAICSFETKVKDHARKLLEKHVKKPFFDRPCEAGERMTPEEYETGKEWLSDTFQLIRFEDDVLPNIKTVLRKAESAVLRNGVRGLVIDPYNELDHEITANTTETEYVSRALSMVKKFAAKHSCHVWFVAHPRQLRHWMGGPPDMYDISGSAHFMNKCDNGIVIHRNRDANVGPLDQVQVCVRKVRNKVVGTIGEAFLSYNRTTGEYSDIAAT